MIPQRQGFTLIELLIVVVVIGILAAIAIPKYSTMKEKSYLAAVTADLKNMVTRQEIYVSDHDTYAGTVADMEITLTDAVIVSINEATGTGWAATGTHRGLSGRQCGIYFGSASAAGASPAAVPGVVQCD